jgi:hypothetical protein
VLDGGFDSDGALYLVLELLDGVSMREALDEDALQPENVVQIGIELLEALAAAHDRGFIHRDIKPDNVFLAHDGRDGVTVKLLDFGIASMRDDNADVRLTHSGAVLGTPLYMSPEQATGQRVDARSDLWSVGALLYRALSGASPFDGDNYNALIVSIVSQEHLPLAERRGGLPAALHAVVERALAKDPGQRFQSAREMLEALRAVRCVRRQQRPVAVARPRRTHALPILACAAMVPALFGVLRLMHDSEPSVAQVAESRMPATAETLPLTAAKRPQPGLSVEQITGVLAAEQPHMQSCLQDAMLAQRPTGPTTLRLDIELHIASNGRTDNVRAEGAVPAVLQQCVIERLRDAMFPAAENASEFRYPLILESTIIGQ